MNTYLVNTSLGFMLVKSDTPTNAYIKYLTERTPLEDMFLDRNDLLARNYTTLETTKFENVYKLIYKNKCEV